MKKLTILLIAFASCTVLSLGCSTGPGEGSVEEAQQSMEESMELDTMAETTEAPAAEATTTP